MQNFSLATLALILAACGRSEPLISHGGLSLTGFTDTSPQAPIFTGLPATLSSQMPMSNTVGYSGVYDGKLADDTPGTGTATMTVDFGTGVAQLDLTGDFTLTARGAVSNSTIERVFPPIEDSILTGQFFGTTAQAIGGTFAGDEASSGQVAAGFYIVSR